MGKTWKDKRQFVAKQLVREFREKKSESAREQLRHEFDKLEHKTSKEIFKDKSH